jgi:hypothetical protein
MAVYFTKVSGVIRVVTDGGSIPRTYYSVNSRVEADQNNNQVTIFLSGNSYTLNLADIVVNGQIPRTLSEAVTLLTSLIGT